MVKLGIWVCDRWGPDGNVFVALGHARLLVGVVAGEFVRFLYGNVLLGACSERTP